MMPKTATINPAPHVVIAERYARDVITKKLAGPGVRKAAQRHLDNLAAAKSKSYPFYFCHEEAERACDFIELLPHTKGRWAQKQQLIVLEPWQCFLVCVLFGWLRKSNSKRRFRSVYWEIPRKNGKSLLAAAIGLFMQFNDGEYAAEVYSGATTEKQAWEVFGPAKIMVERTPDLVSHFGVEIWKKIILRPSDGSKFEPIIGNPGDGASPSCAIVDEYHEHQTPNLHDTMETGMGSREQPLMLVITTAGYNTASPCHEKHDEVQKILDNTLENDEMFGVLFDVDAEDDWADPKILRKANPNYDVSVDGDFLRAQQRSAMSNPIQQNKFKTKHLNVWCSVLAGVMNMQQWEMSEDKMLEEEELEGSEVYIAIDLASKSDLCTEQRLHVIVRNGLPHYYLFGRYWLPEAAIEEDGPNKAHYQKWVKTGALTQTEGATVDFEMITDQVKEDCARLNPKEVVYDPFNATQMAQRLLDDQIECVEFVQNPQNFAVPIDELLAAVKDGRFHHDGNEITKWCMSNVVARPAKKGLFSPVKQKGKEHQKIDGAVAAFMAMGRATVGKEREPENNIMFI